MKKGILSVKVAVFVRDVRERLIASLEMSISSRIGSDGTVLRYTNVQINELDKTERPLLTDGLNNARNGHRMDLDNGRNYCRRRETGKRIYIA